MNTEQEKFQKIEEILQELELELFDVGVQTRTPKNSLDTLKIKNLFSKIKSLVE